MSVPSLKRNVILLSACTVAVSKSVIHKAHNETIPRCRFAEKPCAASIFAKRKSLIVSNTSVSKLSTLFGGAEGSRTPVRKRFNKTFSGRRTDSGFPPRAGTAQTARLGRVMMHGRGNSYPPHVRHINDAFPGLWPLRFRRLPLVRQRQQYDCCQLIFKLPVLWRSGAAARLSSLHTPVETGAAPYRSIGKDCIFLPFRVRSPPPGRLFP